MLNSSVAHFCSTIYRTFIQLRKKIGSNHLLKNPCPIDFNYVVLTYHISVQAFLPEFLSGMCHYLNIPQIWTSCYYSFSIVTHSFSKIWYFNLVFNLVKSCVLNCYMIIFTNFQKKVHQQTHILYCFKNLKQDIFSINSILDTLLKQF